MLRSSSDSGPITEEEIEAWLARRPFREEDLAVAESFPQHYLTVPQGGVWPSTHPHLGTDWQSVAESQYAQQDQSSSSAFAAQFLSGTPGNEILLQALADQQRGDEAFGNVQHLLDTPSHPVSAAHLLHSPISMPKADDGLRASEWDVHQPQQQPRQPQFATPASAFRTHQLTTSSPQSDLLSSPEETRAQARHAFRTPPSRVSQTSLHSLPEQEPFDVQSLASPAVDTMLQQQPSLAMSRSPTEVRLTQRSSAEIEAIRMRSHVRRTYAGSSSRISSVYSPTVSIAATSPLAATTTSTGRPTSASSDAQHSMLQVRSRPRADTTMSSSSSSSSIVDLNQRVAQQHMQPAFNLQSERSAGPVTGIPSSLSAELAGLGLNANNFLQHDGGDEEEWGGLEGRDTSMQDDTSMQSAPSSSSASMTNRRTADVSADLSLFSHRTVSSSGLDDSVFSHNDGNASRWIHGRDTPPSTPPRKDEIRAGPMVDSAHSRLQYAQTWPRSMSDTSSADVSSAQHTPSMTHSSGIIGPDGSVSDAGFQMHSPIQQSYNDNPNLHVRYPALGIAAQRSFTGLQHTVQTALPQQSQWPQAMIRRIHSSGEQSAAGSTLSERGMSKVRQLRASGLPAAPPQPLTGAASNRRADKKRWSMSNMAVAKTSLGRTGQPTDQYEQVSAALDTLRTFLRQRDNRQSSGGGHGLGRSPRTGQGAFSQQPRTSSRQGDAHPSITRQASGSGYGREFSSSTAKSDAGPRLRHSGKQLPSRGSLSRISGGAPVGVGFAQHLPSHIEQQYQHTQQQHQLSSLSPSSSFVEGLSSSSGRRSDHSSFSSAQPGMHANTNNVDRIATLENLAERLQRMREADRHH